MKSSRRFMLSVSAIAIAAVPMTPTFAADGDEAVVEEIQVIGSRSNKPRSATDSPVPIDVLSGDQFNSLGNGVDITDNLKALVPSYTATPATGDGSAFVRPTSMRGLAPDQMLILIDGKRRHRSALLHFFAPAAGNGAHGPDVGMIPSIALKRVEVLRDGASAQYGSDAIAGVMNFVTKDASEGGQVIAQYGQFYEGETSYKIAANVGMPLGDNGFVNISAEHVSNDALSRGIQRPVAQDLIDDGVAGVGADSPFGDAPFVQTWGRPETSASRLFLNSGVELSDTADVYFRANYAQADGRYRFFYRAPNHSTITALEEDFGWESSLPAGFTPYLDGAQTDISLIGGLKGEFGDEIYYDFSVSYGKNELDYFLNNTLNGQLNPGTSPQRDFDVGMLAQSEYGVNADFSRALSDNVNLAFGMEYRKETYTVTAGEPNSYVGGGSSGMKGFTPENSGSFGRNNWAAYVDIEHDISDEFMMQYAVRYEDFSDFGSTINGKIAGRYNVSDAVTLRASVSTGFHAPTTGQQNVRASITTFDGITGAQVEEGLLPPTHPVSLANGGAPLTEEKSINFSFGMTAALGEYATLTTDFYRIEVSDHIYRVGDIAYASDPDVPDDLDASVSFFTNSLDVVSQGVDVVLTGNYEWGSDASTDLSLAYNYNKVEIVDQKLVNGINPVSASTVEDIENNYPKHRFVLTALTHFGDKWSFMARANYYGSHYDERGTIDPLIGSGNTAEIGSIIYIDAELTYDLTDNISLTAGASNLFDSYVDELGAPYDNRMSVGLQYPRRSAANYEGGSWYLRLGAKF